jgi:predicted kinase
MRSNLIILVLIGIPASGKSTWSKEYVRRNPDYVRVNRDEFRLMLKDSQLCENKIEDMITSLVNATVSESLAKKLNVIIDSTNLKMKYITAIIEKFQHSADIHFRLFDISLKKAIERDADREQKVGEGVIKKMHKDYVSLFDSFDFKSVKQRKGDYIQPDFDSKLPHAVVFDIDGTLALMGNRGPFEWHNVDRDNLNKIVSEQVDFHRRLGRKIILVTGRDQSCCQLTKDWCEFYGIQFDEMHMRPAGDNRKDTYVKQEIYETYLRDKYNILCVYDDRLQVLDMWYKQGIFTFNVNQGQLAF